MERFDKPWIAIFLLVGFLVTAWYSLHYEKPLQDFTQQKLSAYDSSKTKPYVKRYNKWEYERTRMTPLQAAQVVELFDPEGKPL